MYPLVLLIAVTTFYRRVPFGTAWLYFSAAAFVCSLFVQSAPMDLPPEDNLAYAHVIRLPSFRNRPVETRNIRATVLSAWPMTDEADPPRAWLSQTTIMTFTG